MSYAYRFKRNMLLIDVFHKLRWHTDLCFIITPASRYLGIVIMGFGFKIGLLGLP